MTVTKIAASGGVDLEPTDRRTYVASQEGDAQSVEIEKHDIDADTEGENGDGILDSNSGGVVPQVPAGTRVATQTVKSSSAYLKSKLTRKIFLAGWASPVLVFCGCFIMGLIIFLLNFVMTGKVDIESLIGMFYGGAVYAVFVVAVSVPATLLFGLPLSYVAWKLKVLTKKIILLGATISGAVCLLVLASIFLSSVERSLLLICLAMGASGGLVNGYAFLRLIRR